MSKNIEIESVKSLFLKMYFNDTHIATGTGFLVKISKGYALFTARHNLTGKHAITGAPLDEKYSSLPNKVEIFLNKKNSLGKWFQYTVCLYQDNNDLNSQKLWFEHPKYADTVDVAALLILDSIEIDHHDYDITNNGAIQIDLSPTDMVSVIGFPFGKSSHGYIAIWSTGFIASEPEIDYENQPKFLIDCRSRPGQSGSPVIAFRKGGNIKTKNGDIVITPKEVTNFLGIYTGRINKESDLGIVWKKEVIADIIEVM